MGRLFGYYGIDSSFLSLSVDQIIAKAWFILLGSLILYLMLINFERSEHDNSFKITIDKVGTIQVFFIIGFMILITNLDYLSYFSHEEPLWPKILLLLSSLILLLSIKHNIKNRYYNINQIQAFYFIISAVCFSNVYFWIEGMQKAKYLEKTPASKLTIELKGDFQPTLNDVILITHMDGKYFVFEPPFAKNHKVIIIRDDE